MASIFPEELSLTLLDQIPFRALQIRQIRSLLSVRLLIFIFDTQLTLTAHLSESIHHHSPRRWSDREKPDRESSFGRH